MSEASEMNIGRDSKWTSIYWSVDEGELRPLVRLTPNFLEMEKLGFSHGLSVSPTFDTEAEANLYADRIDTFIEAMVRESEAAHTTEQPSFFLSKSVASMGRLPRWVKALLVGQFATALLISAFLTMMLTISTDHAWAMHQLAMSVVDLRDVPAMNDLASVFRIERKASHWWSALCVAATVASVLGAIVVSLIPRKRAQPTQSSTD